MTSALLEQFVTEAAELLEVASASILHLERDPTDSDTINTLFRAIHTLKGASGLIDCAPLTGLAHVAEDVLTMVRSGHHHLTPDVVDLLLSALDQMSAWLKDLEEGGSLPADAAEVAAPIINALNAFVAGGAQAGDTHAELEAEKALLSDEAPHWLCEYSDSERLKALEVMAKEGRAVCAIRYEPHPHCFFSGDDPLNLVAQVPGRLVVRATAIEPWAPPEALDPYVANLRFDLLSTADMDELSSVFQYNSDEVDVRTLRPEDLILPAGEIADSGACERFAEEAGALLRDEDRPGLIEATRALLGSTPAPAREAHPLKALLVFLEAEASPPAFVSRLIASMGKGIPDDWPLTDPADGPQQPPQKSPQEAPPDGNGEQQPEAAASRTPTNRQDPEATPPPPNMEEDGPAKPVDESTSLSPQSDDGPARQVAQPPTSEGLAEAHGATDAPPQAIAADAAHGPGDEGDVPDANNGSEPSRYENTDSDHVGNHADALPPEGTDGPAQQAPIAHTREADGDQPPAGPNTDSKTVPNTEDNAVAAPSQDVVSEGKNATPASAAQYSPAHAERRPAAAGTPSEPAPRNAKGLTEPGIEAATSPVPPLEPEPEPAPSPNTARDGAAKPVHAPGPADQKSTAAKKVLRIEQSRIDGLMDLIGELVVAKNSLPYLARRARDIYGSREMARELKDHYAVIERITQDLQANVMAVRMLPVDHVFQRLPRLVRDVSRKLGKDINLCLEGADTEADKTVIENLRDPLVHIVRNGIDHGIEMPDEREALGKPRTGTLTLTAFNEGDRVVIEIVDDGSGINISRVKRKAMEAGIIDQERAETMSDADAANLIFAPGFSTKDEVSDISGRGVGMDVVRATVEKAGGSVSLSTVSGKGSRIRLSLPLTLAVTRIMTVECGDQLYGVPMDLICETVRLDRSALQRVRGREVFVLRDTVVPLIRLAHVLDLKPKQDRAAGNPDDHAVMVVSLGNNQTGIVVDAFREVMEVIVKPMDGIMEGISGYMGTSLMGDGRVIMILDLKEMLECRYDS
ncbi:MAG: chemotaxis protein CheW [Pseudomonadota bacterium]